MKPQKDLPKDDPTERISKIINRISKINSFGAWKLAREISQYQPCSAEIFIPFEFEFEGKRAFHEILKILFVIWECYKDQDNIKSIKLKSEQFDTILNMHSKLSKTLNDNPTESEVENQLSKGIDMVESKALFTGLYHWYLNNPIIYDRIEGVNVFLFKEVRCMIDCFDAIVDGSISNIELYDWGKSIGK